MLDAVLALAALTGALAFNLAARALYKYQFHRFSLTPSANETLTVGPHSQQSLLTPGPSFCNESAT